MRKHFFVLALVLTGIIGFGALPAEGRPTECDGAVASSVDKAYPGAKIVFCFRRNFKPTPAIEVRINTPDKHHFDMWVGTDGHILSAEEKLAVKALPPAVADGFAAKYPKMTIKGAFRVYRNGATEYKLRYTDEHGWHNVLYAANGSYIMDAPLMSAPFAN